MCFLNETFNKLQSVLDNIHTAQDKLVKAKETIAECERALSDIGHRIEFAPCSGPTASKLIKRSREIRQKRRAAKLVVETHGPLVAWASCNKKALEDLSSARSTFDREMQKPRTYTTRVLHDMQDDIDKANESYEIKKYSNFGEVIDMQDM